MKLGNTISNVQIPARPATNAGTVSPLKQAMDNLEIGDGIDFVVEGKDKQGNPKKPELKNQYAHVNPGYWAPKGKTMKVFEAQDQSGLGEFETRYVAARVEFVTPVVRKTKAVAPVAPVATAEQEDAAAE